ncbi:hypothetical protein EJ04DRAFT_557572 [Polyplosphaeria fusca]|uniref:Lysine-specific metallo-endopeptidase domain-containing protein n=1 Tax=Polyplosphaeria fusca TaxID=682080 RepID=A0A9P4QLQ2_9PLEO|nr:hypothetical protein EJ04DRAFT_557572 [Polyplosphaeria fusca]
MHFSQVTLLAFSACLSASVATPTGFSSLRPFTRRGTPNAHAKLLKRGEPETGDDLPDSDDHPNQLDKVETAFNDALELTSYALTKIDGDTDIFPHYFDDGDRAEIKRIFETINKNDAGEADKGSDYLSKILVQTTDRDGKCDSSTLAYSGDYNTDKPFIVLCPNAFKKKAVTALKGKESEDSDALDFYMACSIDGGQIGDHVSWTMNSLGMTLLHEYMHMDGMIKASFGSIVDDPNGNPGYGPVNVYDKIPKDQARINADSYAYYASHVLWSVLCQQDFQAPRAGEDDNDPDCGGNACKP